MRIANLYAGIGGNRQLWGDEHEITAVEIVPEIAQIYKDLYPNDNVIIGDAHEFLRKHFKEFDFIWASPPCPTHSRLQFMQRTSIDRKYPDMTLYQEIILLQTFFKGKWVIENVKPYYSPLISPTFIMDRHYFWSSNFIMTAQFNSDKSYTDIRNDSRKLEQALGFDLSKYRGTTEIRKVLRNCVRPEVGLYIFEHITGGVMLVFNLKKEWFEKIKSGEKTHEYRIVKDYWFRRLFLFSTILCKQTTIPLHNECEFVCGYARKSDISKRLKAKIKRIRIINGLESDLKVNSPVFDIEFELINEVQNEV